MVSGRPSGARLPFNGMRETLTRKLQKLALNIKCFLPRLKHNLMQHELQNNSRLKKKINNAVTPIIQKRRSSLRGSGADHHAGVGGSGGHHHRNGGSGGQPRVTQAQMFAKNCFPEPQYGFRTKVTLSESQPCVKGRSDCVASGNNSGFARRMSSPDPHYPTMPAAADTFSRRQSNLEFSIEGAPECVIAHDHANRCQYVDPYHYHQHQ